MNNRGRLVCAVFLAVATTVTATVQVVLEADGDSYVKYYEEWESDPEYADDNFGGEPLMYVLDNYYQWGEEFEIPFMHFDFSGLGDYDGTYLVGAQLVLHAASYANGLQQAHAVGGAWEEMTITFNNCPGAGALLASFYMDGGDNYVDLDIGPIAPWVDAPETAYGILIFDTEQVWEDDPPGTIYTRETENAPELWLTFSGPAVEGASWGEIKAAF
ncbi:MAG TPA: DNRLRE domain-containing protein [bacterium]|nr:DNRLRE domain-containing protein [bacterium]